MIGRIKGVLVEKKSPVLLVDVMGVGYEILAPMTTIYKLPEIESEVTLHTHFIVREDVQQLYGFVSKADRRLFQELIKVNGVGAKMALAILSGMDGATLMHCIASQDHGLLVSIPGIGKKTAERMIVEMKDRMDKLSVELSEFGSSSSVGGMQSSNAGTGFLGSMKKEVAEAISALEALGYKNKDAQKRVMEVQSEANDVESLIKLALRSKA